MELHRDQLQKRCRVCRSLLVAKGKKRRAFYQCSEFKECLFRAFSIDINNDLPDIHPVSLCYSCLPTSADIIIATIKGIAPPHHPPDMPLSTLNNSAILNQLQCLICLELLCQPLELPCRALKNIRIGDYNIHDCDAKPTKDKVKMASQVLSKLAATSPDKTISIPTDGLPKTFVQITRPHKSSESASRKTLKRRCTEMSNVRQIMAKGETSVLLRNELDYLDSAERELLLKQAGIISHIGATQALALKWESCYTIQMTSWGYNRTEDIASFWNTTHLLRQLVSSVACNGNLLLNAGPTADGRILPIFEERLTQMGAWLSINGEAIYGNVPWRVQNDTVDRNTWYTASKDGLSVYAITFVAPTPGGELVLTQPVPTVSTSVTLLGYNWILPFTSQSDGVQITFPVDIPFGTLRYAWTIKMTNVN
ncbi:hypothetical protein EMCRGX_G028663 [Ephydatia muelleri]